VLQKTPRYWMGCHSLNVKKYYYS